MSQLDRIENMLHEILARQLRLDGATYLDVQSNVVLSRFSNQQVSKSEMLVDDKWRIMARAIGTDLNMGGEGRR